MVLYQYEIVLRIPGNDRPRTFAVTARSKREAIRMARAESKDAAAYCIDVRQRGVRYV